MVKLKKPPVLIKYRDYDHPIVDSKWRLRTARKPKEFPIGEIYEDKIDGVTYLFKVIEHQYIAYDFIAIIVDDAESKDHPSFEGVLKY